MRGAELRYCVSLCESKRREVDASQKMEWRQVEASVAKHHESIM